MKTLFYITCFFPFIKWLEISGNSDLQPWCLLVTFSLVFYYGITGKKITISRKIFNFYKVIVMGIVIGLIVTILINGFQISRSVRYLATYISLILISAFAYLFCKEDKGFDERKIKIIINIYLIVGIIQRFQKDFLYDFIANARTSENRGVVSLTSEPSFYGYMCIFFMFFVFDFKSNRNIYILNILFQICLLAKSSITILYLGIFGILLVIFNIKKINLKKVVVLVSLFGIVIVVGRYYLAINGGQRIAFFINTLISQNSINNAVNILLNDYSVSVRVNDIKVCLTGFMEYYGIPHGFETRKISSGYGALIFSMGWIGIIIIGFIFEFCRKAYKGQFSKILPLFLTIIMFSAIQLSNPVFSFLIGYFMFLDEKKECEGNEYTITSR